MAMGVRSTRIGENLHCSLGSRPILNSIYALEPRATTQESEAQGGDRTSLSQRGKLKVLSFHPWHHGLSQTVLDWERTKPERHPPGQR